MKKIMQFLPHKDKPLWISTTLKFSWNFRRRAIKSSYLIVMGIVIGATVLTLGALSIPTNIDNSIQTIKTIYISSDGVSTGNATGVVVTLDANAAGNNKVKIRGNIDVGDKTNSISGTWSSIAGGEMNSIVGNVSIIAGGNNNSIKGDNSAVAGGWFNKILAVSGAGSDYSAVVGGNSNIITGDYSTIAGGYQNNISGDYSFVAGYKGQINHKGVFLWSDNYNYPLYGLPEFFTSTTGYSFIIRAHNGVAIGTGATLGMTSLRVWDGTTGRIAAKEYCDENGTGCILASGLGGGAGYRDANGNVLYNNIGSLIGINTLSPTESLDVNGSLRIRTISGATVANNVLVTNSSGKILYIPFSTIMSGNGYRGKNGNDMYNTNTGQVGIGTTNPVATLTVIGSMTAGNDNQANGVNSIAMGYSNIVKGKYSTIGGGSGNEIATLTLYSFIGGGASNTIDTDESFIGGGYLNHIYGGGANVIAGGIGNTIVTSAQLASIGGGDVNSVGGNRGTVPGGWHNEANGDYSFAAGREAIASHTGTFVRNDGSAAFASTNSNQFLIHATNGVGINTATTSNATLTVAGTIMTVPQPAPTCNADKRGSIYYDSSNNHFYGCNETTWKQLDN